MAEWLKAPVLKTGDVERHRGFESLSLRDISSAVEKYPSGRRGSPAKGVGWDNRRPGSNPGFSVLARFQNENGLFCAKNWQFQDNFEKLQFLKKNVNFEKFSKVLKNSP